MKNRRFRIELKTIFGNKNGELQFSENNEAITGSFDILQKKNRFHGFLSHDGKIVLSGSITSLVRVIPFRADGIIENGVIKLTLHSKNGSFPLIGTEVPV